MTVPAGAPVAAIDIGTNTVRLLLSESGRDLVRIAKVVGLGRGVDATGRLGEAAIERTLAGLGTFRPHVEQAAAVRVVATSASRDASNREEFFDGVERVLGHRPQLIDGATEAALAFAGATSGRLGGVERAVIDVGGGSTEFVYGVDRPTYVRSVDIGSVRLTDRHLPTRPASAQQVLEAARAADRIIGEVVRSGAGADIIGVAGTFTSLAAIDAGLAAYDPDIVHGHALRRVRVEALVDRLAGLTVDETAAIPSLDPARAPVLLGGAIVVAAALRHLNAEVVAVSERDILDGIVLSLLPQ